jgi:hypothetical protein
MRCRIPTSLSAAPVCLSSYVTHSQNYSIQLSQGRERPSHVRRICQLVSLPGEVWGFTHAWDSVCSNKRKTSSSGQTSRLQSCKQSSKSCATVQRSSGLSWTERTRSESGTAAMALHAVVRDITTQHSTAHLFVFPGCVACGAHNALNH